MSGYAHRNITKEELEEIKRKLKKERRYSQRTIDRYDPSSDFDKSSKFDNTSLSQDYSRLQRKNILANKERIRLNRIEKAVQRMDENVFGTCLECKERIDVNRIKNIPYTEFCFTCRKKKDTEDISSKS